MPNKNARNPGLFYLTIYGTKLNTMLILWKMKPKLNR